MSAEPDAIVVGASLAGCAAAMLLARQGAHVRLLEQHRDPTYYKRVCTHYIQPGATPVFEELGLIDTLERAGAVRNGSDFWTPDGWVRPRGETWHGYNLRRSVLDPLMREAAAGTPGVELRLGTRVRDVVRDGNRVAGVVATDGSDQVEQMGAPLVVGADGRPSPVATAAGVPTRTRKHGRFGYFAAFEGVRLGTGTRSQIWFSDPDVSYVFPNEHGITVLAVGKSKDQQAAFQEDVDGSFRRTFAALPDGPDLSDARRVSAYVGMVNYPDISRKPAHPGLALVGDAALSADWIWGVGCGWALQSASWLAGEAGPVLAGAPDDVRQLDLALRRYGRRHRAELGGHHFLIADAASGRKFNPLERLMFGAAVFDEQLALNTARFGARLIRPRQFLAPRNVARSIRVRTTAARGRRTARQPA
jgi:2-polyprenyl-6-methoxyphenol hydroxylase-like FAD-dependent oxidoreductase